MADYTVSEATLRQVLDKLSHGLDHRTRFELCEVFIRILSAPPSEPVAWQHHRIAPKEMTLVEELRDIALGESRLSGDRGIIERAADRIMELESEREAMTITIKDYTTDELLDELKRRITP